ncbi:ribonuclease P protein component [Corynebacterium sp. HS2168-gen11]|uniref:ribonuclease P protein component n=1 Tax=Corynebacterium sp. HS2168-gen11 TaxID=2974027 RepID=UPI00216B6266|nr:ribonuclease P protein component [Corynebacterium sp. HS2168-gen11]MCS4535488.1 ribonuclease P protein component [Corynebacterium sp. HS2168-gen11]
MLPSQHKITNSEEFKFTIRKGIRAGGGTVVVYVQDAGASVADPVLSRPPKIGLVVSKAIGNAVTRHAVSRKLRHIMAAEIPTLADNDLVVIRALPPAATASTDQLQHDIQRALEKIHHKRRRKAVECCGDC